MRLDTLAVGRRSHENRSNPREGPERCPRRRSVASRSRSPRSSFWRCCWSGRSSIFSGGTASAKQFATLRLLGGQVAVQTRQRRLRDGRGWHVAPRRRYRSDRPRWAGVDRILRREPYPPRLRHIVHAGDARDPGQRGSLEGHRGQSGRGQLLPSRGGARRRPEPLRDRDPDRRRHRSRARDTRCWWTRHPRRSPWWRGWSRPGDPAGPWRSPRARWRSSEPTASLARSKTIPPQLLESDWLMFNRCADHVTAECVEGDGSGSEEPTEPPKGSGRGGAGVGPRRPPPRAPAVRAARYRRCDRRCDRRNAASATAQPAPAGGVHG